MPSITTISEALKRIVDGDSESPEARSILEIYGAPESELPQLGGRLETVLRIFRDTIAATGEVTVLRAPGRVNLIGEHTDYNGYPVMPMAIDRDIIVVLRPIDGDRISIWNTESRYPARAFETEFPIDPFDQGDWGNYVKAAVHGLLSEGIVRGRIRGFDAVFSGNIPDSAGLSSSAALVVASALAFLHANRQSVDTLRLAEVLARAEQFVGTEGGGMDQAISLLGQEQHALKTDFYPLRTKQVPLPEDFTFVVSHSMVRATKSANARDAYNRRVVECRLAAALGAQALKRVIGTSLQVTRLSDLSGAQLQRKQEEVDRIVLDALGSDPLAFREIHTRLQMPPEEIVRRYCTLRDGSILPEPPDGYMLWKRYRHVISEARRVEEAVEALESVDMTRFGQLMNESHASCRDEYEVSCPELETLVNLGRKYSALGSRLTGAGFGGCTVNLVPSTSIHNLLDGLKNDFYPLPSRTTQPISNVLFATRATRGAGPVFRDPVL